MRPTPERLATIEPVAGADQHPFRQLAITHALMVAADASMVVALANSFFFDVDPNAARSRILSFLLVSFAPFVVLAPLIGPLIDRVKGGRQVVIAAVATARILVQLLMVFWIDSIALYPLVFIALILQKTYTVSKQALVPGAVRDERQLVEANAKLGVIAGLAGAAAVVPASALQYLIGSRGALVFSAVLFGGALVSARQLSPRVVPDFASEAAAAQQSTRDRMGPLGLQIQLSWASMFVLRALGGYMLFYLAFWFRDLGDRGTVYLGLALSAGGLSTMVGNAISPKLSRRVSNETLMMIALTIPSIAGVLPFFVGSGWIAVVVASSVSLGAALGRLSFESVVQRDVYHLQRGRAFARFETRFQLGWVLAALVPVLLRVPAVTGLLLVGATSAATLVVFGLESRRAASSLGSVRSAARRRA